MKKAQAAKKAQTKQAQTKQAQTKKAQAKKQTAPSWSRVFLIVVMALMVLCVGLAFWAGRELTSEKVLSRTFQSIAEDYYENYLYPNFIAENFSDSDYAAEGLSEEALSEVFADYTEHGFATVRLRQLLNYAGGDSRDQFKSGSFECDTNASGVTFVPQAPFGKQDYTAKYSLSCENIE